ncbi:MAG: hypothetical protein M1126_06400 [Candidatus Thermoplasmatota archaeon]|nr:hypothetical protein [Candidatus Thermoplasmatota archaeon]
MSPRKSSTSSGKRTPSRPRYLGIEVAGELVPVGSADAWRRVLDDVGSPSPPSLSYRVVRSDARRAIVAVDQHTMTFARARWNATSRPAGRWSIRTIRTWGTLVGAKSWIRRKASGLSG